jgi:dual specificity phosphatase 12
MSMDEVTPGLWIGDLQSALDVANLKAHKIFSILSAMRGRVTINEVGSSLDSRVPFNSCLNVLQTFIRHQILLDDTEDADILRHLLSSIHFIQAELDKGRGVLVHCHGGISEFYIFLSFYLFARHGRIRP